MFLTIINDCQDFNAVGRQLSKANSLFGFSPCFVGVQNDIEAAGNLIDVLDASEGKEGIVLTNVAPRHGHAKKWPNGTPFGYFYYKNTLVVSSIDGLVLSLVKKLNLTDHINVFDIPTVVSLCPKIFSNYEGQQEYIINTQFRSLEFVPRVAKLVWDKEVVPTEKFLINEVEDCKPSAWWIDNFGNIKTTLLPSDIQFEPGKTISVNGEEIKCYNFLKDVPNGEPAFIIGSSGLEQNRFIELVVQGESAAKRFNLKTGDRIL